MSLVLSSNEFALRGVGIAGTLSNGLGSKMLLAAGPLSLISLCISAIESLVSNSSFLVVERVLNRLGFYTHRCSNGTFVFLFSGSLVSRILDQVTTQRTSRVIFTQHCLYPRSGW